MGVMMKCGHTAQGKSAVTNEPVCVICVGIHPGAKIVDDSPPDLDGRDATCFYHTRKDGKPCNSKQPSSLDLAFFEHRPRQATDLYYCGCWGWD